MKCAYTYKISFLKNIIICRILKVHIRIIGMYYYYQFLILCRYE